MNPFDPSEVQYVTARPVEHPAGYPNFALSVTPADLLDPIEFTAANYASFVGAPGVSTYVMNNRIDQSEALLLDGFWRSEGTPVLLTAVERSALRSNIDKLSSAITYVTWYRRLLLLGVAVDTWKHTRSTSETLMWGLFAFALPVEATIGRIIVDVYPGKRKEGLYEGKPIEL